MASDDGHQKQLLREAIRELITEAQPSQSPAVHFHGPVILGDVGKLVLISAARNPENR